MQRFVSLSILLLLLAGCETGPTRVKIVGTGVGFSLNCMGQATTVDVLSTGERKRICGWWGNPGEEVTVEALRLF